MSVNLKAYRNVNLRRVNALIRFFQTVPKENIDLGTYCAPDRLNETLQEAATPECGTIGCLAGWIILKFGDPRRFNVQYGTLRRTNGDTFHYPTEADRLLGINRGQLSWSDQVGDRLYWANNSKHNYDTGRPSISDRTVILRRLAHVRKYARKAKGYTK